LKILSKEDSDDESLMCHLQKLAGDQTEEEEVQLDGSPIKRSLKNPGLNINKMITKAKREAKEVLMIARNDPTKEAYNKKCMFTLHTVEIDPNAKDGTTDKGVQDSKTLLGKTTKL